MLLSISEDFNHWKCSLFCMDQFKRFLQPLTRKKVCHDCPVKWRFYLSLECWIPGVSYNYLTSMHKVWSVKFEYHGYPHRLEQAVAHLERGGTIPHNRYPGILFKDISRHLQFLSGWMWLVLPAPHGYCHAHRKLSIFGSLLESLWTKYLWCVCSSVGFLIKGCNITTLTSLFLLTRPLRGPWEKGNTVW